MLILKHKSKEEYIFINIVEESFSAFTLSNKRFINWTFQDNHEKFIASKRKKGFEEIAIDSEVLAKVEALVDNFELEKNYYFILKNKRDYTISPLVKINAREKDDGDFSLTTLPTSYCGIDDGDDHEYTSVANFLAHYMPGDHHSHSAEHLKVELKFHFIMLFTMGFELINDRQIIGLVSGKNIEEVIFEGDLYRSLETYDFDPSTFYIQFTPNEEKQWIAMLTYSVNDGAITKIDESYSVPIDTEQFEKISLSTLEALENKEKFADPVKYVDFMEEFPLNLPAIKYFTLPMKVDVVLDKFPLELPEETIPVKDFIEANFEKGKYYFYADTINKDPLKWKVAYIVANIEDDYFKVSEVFTLKDFNKIAIETEYEEYKYSDNKKSFTRKYKKTFKTNNLEPIDSKIIIEALTGELFIELQQQEIVTTFVTDTYHESTYYEVCDNYVCIRETRDINWLFFNNKMAQKKWLSENQTKEHTLYEQDKRYIAELTNKYHALKIKPEDNELKEYYVNHPLLKDIFSSKEKVRGFTRSTLQKEESLHIKGDYQLETDTSIVIDGDLIVDGTLYIGKSPHQDTKKYTFLDEDVYIFIKGNIKAKNFIVDEKAFNIVFVEGTIEVENITRTYRSVLSSKAKTDIFLHEKKHPLEIYTSFEYETEISVYSEAIINNEVITQDSLSYIVFNPKKLNEFLCNGVAFIQKDYTNPPIDYDSHYKEKFESLMKDWGNYYCEMAGCEVMAISEDNQIRTGYIHPGSGDWVVHDTRCNSGTYGYDHECAEIREVKIHKAMANGVNYRSKPILRKVDAVTLMYRYQWISGLFMNWAHRTTVTYGEKLFKDLGDVQVKYEDEKTTFVDDPHLALYWLLHFGLTLDNRYDEVVKIIEENDLVEKLYYFKYALAFFKNTDAFYDLKISNAYSDKKKFEQLFLKRRSYLIYWIHSYKNYDINNIDLWWKSVSIQPNIDEELIVRMRWLKNNLKKCDAWNAFDLLTHNESKNIPLLAYVWACNPHNTEEEKTKYADILISELYEHRNIWKTPHKKGFAEAILWDVRELASNKKLLAQTATFYFNGNETSDEYQDIQKILGTKNENIDEVRVDLDTLNKLFEGYDRFETPIDKKEIYHHEVSNFLVTLKPKIFKEVVINVKDIELAKRCFVYLWKSNIEEKKDALVKLFIYIEFSDYDINKELFGDLFPQLIVDEDDTNLEIAKAFLDIPEEDFRNDSMWKNSKGAAAMFFLKVAQLPKVFSYLIDKVNVKPSKKNEEIIDVIYTHLFSAQYNSKINPTLKFSKEQIEIMLETICNWFLTYGYHEEAYHSIYYCENPLAEEWVRDKYNNKKWLKQFSDIETSYDSLSDELNDALESALEFIEDEKHNAYLEFKDEKSHKFWKIYFYSSRFQVTYGKIGTEGKKTDKDFDSTEECYKAGDKLVQSKLKKGYKIVDEY